MKSFVTRFFLLLGLSLILAFILTFGNGCLRRYATHYGCKSPKWIVSIQYHADGDIRYCETCDVYELRAVGKCEIRRHTGSYCAELLGNVQKSCRIIR